MQADIPEQSEKPLGPQLLRHLESEIEFQCKFAIMAAERLTEALTPRDRTSTQMEWATNPKLVPGYRTTCAWEALQTILVSAANISKLLWGSRSGKESVRRDRAAKRKPLRDRLHVQDGSPIESLRVRNQFEHFDEKLEERHDKAGPIHAQRNIDVNISGGNLPQPQHFGHYNSTTGQVAFWDDEMYIPDVLAEIRRIYARTYAGRKNHFEP